MEFCLQATAVICSSTKSANERVSAKGRHKEEDSRMFVCDKRDMAFTFVFCRDLHLPFVFSGFLQKDMFKERLRLIDGKSFKNK